MKKPILGIIAGLLVAASAVFAQGGGMRVWTNSKGQSVEASLKGIEGDNVTLVLRNGKSHSMTMSDLSKPDQEWIEQNDEKARAAKAAAEAAKAPVMAEIKDDLVRLEEGSLSSYELATPPEYFLIYSAASW